ncbi:hypothetical protein L3V43_22065 [Pseudoalteromonas sp. L23]|uniref:hypothetical protein n=1 Tax=unclassified Pseudoalteromonas TaxID=194690 RepID=UPI001EEF79D1|nr:MULTISPECIES: hypothetical protein [unclassified Pseudoalteromonas]MCF7516558.1 hypothetical protein [Pseudoalteromonas sp. L7]MCF7528341.1 hypothetical protein [Pseudoalteromonas sp. L23]MCX2769753.1 hypothetical protein [Pseudoalteromonas sp. B530]
MKKKNKIDVTISSDIDYENLIAEIHVDGNFIGLVTNEPHQGVCFELPDGQADWNKIGVSVLIQAIEIAKIELLQE